MAADFHIHVFDESEKDAVIAAYKTTHESTIGSKYEDLDAYLAPKTREEHEAQNEASSLAYKVLEGCPGIWVGSVSWLKQALDAEGDYVPNVIDELDELVGEDFPVIDDDFIAMVKAIYMFPSEHHYRTNDPKNVMEFIQRNKGKRCFSVSW